VAPLVAATQPEEQDEIAPALYPEEGAFDKFILPVMATLKPSLGQELGARFSQIAI
jgi:hypothetical protein